ncbi:MAG: hypothetical protein J5879_10045 [Clostridia bacterium]|nr:hypothetical protein [Clostridia bacterium]
MELRSSKTFQNLINAYIGECHDHVKYKFLAYGAKTQKLFEVEKALEEISKNEFHHGRMFYTAIQKASPDHCENLRVDAGYPFREKWELLDNLEYSARTEQQESADIYPAYAKIADDEGFGYEADLFRLVAAVENCHMMQLDNIRRQMTDGNLYHRGTPVKWKCANCGHEQTSCDAPQTCPLCGSEQGHVKLILPDN